MPESNSKAIHLVVQHTQTEKDSLFRIVAYRAGARFQPAEFLSLNVLVKELESALAGFDERWLRLREPEYRGTYIIFMGDFDLNESQLLQLGLRRV